MPRSVRFLSLCAKIPFSKKIDQSFNIQLKKFRTMLYAEDINMFLKSLSIICLGPTLINIVLKTDRTNL